MPCLDLLKVLRAPSVVKVQDSDYPDHLFYDVDNQIWYDALEDETARAGFTPWAASLMGEVLVFTPKRIGREFEKDRSFATVEGGKWVGSARAAFDGVVIAHNELLVRKPELLTFDSFGEGWMLVVRPLRDDWRDSLVTGADIEPAFDAWVASGAYRDRAE
jgi:glycine cleavage system H protein